MNYTEFTDNIKSYMEIDATVFTPTVLGNFILVAENRVMRDVDLDAFKEYDVATIGTTQPKIAVPSGFLFARYLQYIPTSGDRVFLEQRDISFMTEYTANTSTNSALPKYYGLWDQSTLYIAPALTGSLNYQLELAYFRRTDQLSAANPNTWLSDNAPEVLTYAVLVEAYLFTKGPLDVLGQFQQRYMDSVQKLAMEQQGRGRRDEYRDGMLRVPLISNPPPYARGS
jgi:hypothetical protein